MDPIGRDEMRRRLTDLVVGLKTNGQRVGRDSQTAVIALIDRDDFASALRTMVGSLAADTTPVTDREREEFTELARELAVDHDIDPLLVRCPSIPIESDIAAVRELDRKLLRLVGGSVGVSLVCIVAASLTWKTGWVIFLAVFVVLGTVGLVVLCGILSINAHRKLAVLRRQKQPWLP